MVNPGIAVSAGDMYDSYKMYKLSNENALDICRFIADTDLSGLVDYGEIRDFFYSYDTNTDNIIDRSELNRCLKNERRAISREKSKHNATSHYEEKLADLRYDVDNSLLGIRNYLMEQIEDYDNSISSYFYTSPYVTPDIESPAWDYKIKDILNPEIYEDYKETQAYLKQIDIADEHRKESNSSFRTIWGLEGWSIIDPSVLSNFKESAVDLNKKSDMVYFYRDLPEKL
jgi:hypothetical protein